MSIQTMQKTIADYFKTQPVLKAWLFGSFARGEESPLSDVDIMPERMLRPKVRENVNQDKKLIYERTR